MSAATQPEIVAQLEQAGAVIRGRRFNCPACGGKLTGSIYANGTRYKCWHDGCEFRSGFRREGLSRAGYRELYHRKDAAERLYQAVHSRRMWLLGALFEIATIERLANELGPEHPATWAALALVSEFRPELVRELAALENASAPDVFRFMNETDETRQAVLNCIRERGGLNDSDGKLVEVNT
jgi:hypothetical protein